MEGAGVVRHYDEKFKPKMEGEAIGRGSEDRWFVDGWRSGE
jgi:hypothetical protein